MKKQFISFGVRSLVFCIEVERVQEIIRGRRSTPVPLAPGCLTGLINLRGQIVPVVDLQRRLCLADSAPSGSGMNVVVRYAAGPVSFRVDTVGDVLEIDPQDALAELPPTVHGLDRRLVRGVFPRAEGLLLVLDVDRVSEWGSSLASETHSIVTEAASTAARN